MMNGFSFCENTEPKSTNQPTTVPLSSRCQLLSVLGGKRLMMMTTNNGGGGNGCNANGTSSTSSTSQHQIDGDDNGDYGGNDDDDNDDNRHRKKAHQYQHQHHQTVITTNSKIKKIQKDQSISSKEKTYQWIYVCRETLYIVLLCIVSYHNALSGQFIFDDISAIKENADLRPSTPIGELLHNDYWGQPMAKEHSHKSYRPVSVFTFRLNYAIHQLEPFGYHLVNILLHTLVCLLYWRYCRLIMNPKCSLLAAMLFSVHPIHTEAVTSVVGRAETLCATFFLSSLLAYSQATKRGPSQTEWRWLIVSIVMTFLATFSKEQGITAIALCLCYEVFHNQRLHQSTFGLVMPLAATAVAAVVANGNSCISSNSNSSSKWTFGRKWKKTTMSATFSSTFTTSTTPKWIKEMVLRMVVLIVSATLMVVLRLRVMHSQLPVFTRFDNPAAYAPTPTRQMTHNYLFAVNAWLLLNPMNLCCDWTMGTISLLESWYDSRQLATVLFYLILGSTLWHAFTIARHRPEESAIIFHSLSLIIFPFIPASNIFFYVGFVIAERVLYIPSFGFCILVAYGYCRLVASVNQRNNKNNNNNSFATIKRYSLYAALAVVIVAHTTRTIIRNEDWTNEYTLFESGIKVNPYNAKLFNNLGHAYESDGDLRKALHYFLRATEIQSDDLGAHLNVGRTYARLHEPQMAERYYRNAQHLLSTLLEQYKASSSHHRTTTTNTIARIAPSHLSLFIHLGNLIAQNHTRLPEVVQLYRQAIKLRPDFVDAYINLGEVLIKLNQTDGASQVYRRALQYAPKNADIHYNLGVLALQKNLYEEAIGHLDSAIRFNPKHLQALLNYAIAVQYLEQKSTTSTTNLMPLAEERLRAYLTLDTTNERVYFYLGMITMNDQMNRLREAEHYFTTAVQLRPNFRSALFNLALLLTNTNRPLEALPHLRRLTTQWPDHLKGLTLLGDVLINTMKDYEQAKQCYRRILQLDPNNILARHNLCVVHVEQGALDQAEQCLAEATAIAPHKDYVRRHLKIVRLRILKLRELQLSLSAMK